MIRRISPKLKPKQDGIPAEVGKEPKICSLQNILS